MWPCNSIIIAFVWFVTHGKLTQNFKCGHFRVFLKISYPCSSKSNSIPLDEIPQGTCELFPTQKLDTGVPRDDGSCAWTWGQWYCPSQHQATRNGTPEFSPVWWSTQSAPNAEDPRKCLPVKHGCCIIAVCSLSCWPSPRFLPDESFLSSGEDDYLPPAPHTLLERQSYAVCAFTNLRLKNCGTCSADPSCPDSL